VKREKTNKMQQSDVYYQLLSQHVSGIIMPIFRRTNTVCYCIWCTALVLLDVVGSGCGALHCRMRALLASYNVETEVDNKHLIVASCWFSFSSHFAHNERSQEPKTTSYLTFYAVLYGPVSDLLIWSVVEVILTLFLFLSKKEKIRTRTISRSRILWFPHPQPDLQNSLLNSEEFTVKKPRLYAAYKYLSNLSFGTKTHCGYLHSFCFSSFFFLSFLLYFSIPSLFIFVY